MRMLPMKKIGIIQVFQTNCCLSNDIWNDIFLHYTNNLEFTSNPSPSFVIPDFLIHWRIRRNDPFAIKGVTIQRDELTLKQQWQTRRLSQEHSFIVSTSFLIPSKLIDGFSNFIIFIATIRWLSRHSALYTLAKAPYIE